jgi:MFS family permease
MVALNCTVKNFGGLVALRVLLGCFESAVAPAYVCLCLIGLFADPHTSLILITSMWYKPRVGLWYVGTGTGTMIGALASFGLQHYHSSAFHSWQIMFLVFGLITIAVGILVIVFLPNNPMTSRLSRDEKIWAIERLRENQTGIENKHFKPHQALECFRDSQTWLLGLITVCSNVPNGAVSSYQATIIKGFGYTSEQTALLSLPGDAKAGKLIGNYMTNCIGASLPLLYSWVAANYAGHTKKVTMNAVLLMSFCLGNIIGPETFQNKDAPDFIPAKITIVVTVCVAIVLTITLRFVYMRENRRRDRVEVDLEHKENQEFLDLTDRQNMEFRVSVTVSKSC